MGKLNLDKAIEEGKKQIRQNPKYDMRYLEWQTLASKGPVNAASDAFSFGFLQGMKAARARSKKQNGFT